MTPEAMRVAVAKACGWKQKDPENEFGWWVRDDGGEWPRSDIPHYESDLNAMHEAEKTLCNNERFGSGGYISWLWYIVEGDSQGDVDSYWDLSTATSLQRCEAFLRAKGLWVEEEK